MADYNPFRSPSQTSGGYSVSTPTGSGMSLQEKLRAEAVKRAAANQGVTTTPPPAGPTLVRSNATPTPMEGPLEPPKPPNVDIATPSPTPLRTINTRTNEALVNGAPAPVTVAAPENTNVATPSNTNIATPSASQRSINTVTGEAFLDGKKVEPQAPAVAPLPKKTLFDFQREQVDANTAKQLEARRGAVERWLSGRGISDSGIALGQIRQAEQGVLHEAAGQKNQINMDESGQDYKTTEAEKGRIWASGENKEDRSLTTSENALGRTHQTDENREARVWQSGENLLGRKFTTSEREAIQVYNTLERIGIQSFEALEAALDRDLTTSERKAIQAWQDANREDEQTYGTSERVGAQDHQIGMYDKDVKTSVKLGVLNAIVTSLDPKAPDFMAKVEEYTTRLFGPGIISARTGTGTTGGGSPVTTQRAPGMIRDTPAAVESIMDLPNPLNPPNPTFPGPTGPTIPGRTGPTQPTGPFGLPDSVPIPSVGDVIDIAVNNPVTRAISRWLPGF